MPHAVAGKIGSLIVSVSWQLIVLSCLVWCLTYFWRKAPASLRYALWLLVLVKVFVSPFINLPSQPAALHRVITPISQSIRLPYLSAINSSAVQGARSVKNLQSTNLLQVKDNNRTDVAWIMIIWLSGVAIMAMLLFLRYRQQRNIIRDLHPINQQTKELLFNCTQYMHMKRLPRIGTSSKVSAPMLVGLFHPTILVPENICQTCSQSDLSAMLLHELAHMKRFDMAGVWLFHLAQMFFFFHPSIWLAGHHLERERELACDEMVLTSYSLTRKEYAAGYLHAVKLANGIPSGQAALAMAEPFDMEKQRLTRILNNAVPAFSAKWILALLAIAVLGLPSFTGAVPSNSKPPNQPDTALSQRMKAADVTVTREIAIEKGNIYLQQTGRTECKLISADLATYEPLSKSDTGLSASFWELTYNVAGKITKLRINTRNGIVYGQRMEYNSR